MRHILFAGLAGLVVLSLGACERREAAHPSVPPPSKLAADAIDSGLLAAAEPFQALARSAFIEKLPLLDREIAEAVAIAQHVKPGLPPDAQRELKSQLDAIAAARQVEDRAGMAAASVEIYRLFVSHAPPAMVPPEVNLLRYAGLRYEVDLKARPIRWEDMVESAGFAQRTWAAVQGRVSDAAFRERVSKALADMAAAAHRRDATFAAAADRRALEVASLLEVATTRR
jgi:hypothetical protein